MRTVLLLICSNIFMTVAWYGHLRYKHLPLLLVILGSWLIALPEYAFQVPANRLGYGQFSATQLKIFQEIISVTAFIIFGFVYLKETPTLKTAAAFLLIIGAVALAASDRDSKAQIANPQQAVPLEDSANGHA